MKESLSGSIDRDSIVHPGGQGSWNLFSFLSGSFGVQCFLHTHSQQKSQADSLESVYVTVRAISPEDISTVEFKTLSLEPGRWYFLSLVHCPSTSPLSPVNLQSTSSSAGSGGSRGNTSSGIAGASHGHRNSIFSRRRTSHVQSGNSTLEPHSPSSGPSEAGSNFEADVSHSTGHTPVGDVIQLYLNGRLQAMLPLVYPRIPRSSPDNGGDLGIQSTLGGFQGQLSRFYFLNEPLQARQIASIYLLGNMSPDTGADPCSELQSLGNRSAIQGEGAAETPMVSG